MAQATTVAQAAANAEAVSRLTAADPVLVDVRPAIDAVPGFSEETILTSGAPMPWESYTGGQRQAIIGGALYEGLAATPEEAEAKLAGGEIVLGACHDYGCVGSLAGIYTASMPVFVLENRAAGNVAFCNSFEGPSRKRLNYGVYDDDVRATLLFLHDVIAPVLGEAVRSTDGGVPLAPLIRRALTMGDELHSRNTAATLLFARGLFPALLDLEQRRPSEVREVAQFVSDNDYFFLRLSMAAAKATADAAHGVEASSVVTAMTFSCREYAIRVSGLDDDWFRGPLPELEAKLFEGFTEDDIEFMGGESVINETIGLGGFAQAAAPALQDYQGGSVERMIERNLEMYEITAGEHPTLRVPALAFRGVPVGIDVVRVCETGITPVLDIGVAGRMGGQIGAGSARAPVACFESARRAHAKRYAVRERNAPA
jgi:hypothetical protein